MYRLLCQYVVLVCTLAVFLTPRAQAATLLDVWRASDLDVLGSGDLAGSWSSQQGRVANAPQNEEPVLLKGVTPSGASVVRFEFDRLTTANSPVAGLAEFSIALVFRAEEPGVNEAQQWYGKSGIVDAEQGGVTDDWGVVIDEQGAIGLGTGNPDATVLHQTGNSLVDGRFHVALLTWGNGTQSVYVDDRLPVQQPLVSTRPRNNAGLTFGDIHTGEGNRYFHGDLTEVRFYAEQLGDADADAILRELAGQYLVGTTPFIHAFVASPDQIYRGQSAALSWDVSNGASLQIDPTVGTVSGASGAVAVSPTSTTTYTLTASNTDGSATAQVTVFVDPGVPSALPQQLNVTAGSSLPLTLTGTDPIDEPLTFTVASPPVHGALTGTSPNLIYTPEAGFLGSDQFTFVAHDAANTSEPAAVTITVLPLPQAPTVILLSTLALPLGSGPGDRLALLRATDANPGDTHTFSLTGAAPDNDVFVIDGATLKAGAGFDANVVGRGFSIRIRAEDSAGLTLDQDFDLQVADLPRPITINEIHYNPSDNTSPTEFVELFNPGYAEVDLAGWWLGDGLSYVFPPGARIAPQGYVVVARDPATLLQTHGVVAFGPWSGVLSNEGERVTLRDAGNTLVDEVDYGPEFPWPIGANGSGGSMELIHPLLNNDLGSSWATSPAPPSESEPEITWIPSADTQWHYRKGTNEPSAPIDAWRLAGFSEDDSWRVGQTSIGYGDGDDITVLDDMQGNFTSVLLRHSFVITGTPLPTRLQLRLYSDDGAIVWINGREVARAHILAGEIDVDDVDSVLNHEAAWETFNLTDTAAYLVPGENWVAVQAMNDTLTSSDFSIDLELKTPTVPSLGPQPTPGRENGSFLVNAPPNIRQVNHAPQQPRSTDAAILTAKVTDPEGVERVELHYQIVPPGAYIPAVIPLSPAQMTADPTAEPPPNPLFEQGWITVPMHDDGTDGDAQAGDDVYSVQLPPQANRTLVRYRLTVHDVFGASRLAPFEDDPSLNFGLFVYDDLPDYAGVSAEVLGALPGYSFLTRAEDMTACTAYSSSDQLPQTVGSGPNEARFSFNWVGTFVYDGEVYDHVRYRLRGANGRYQNGKRNFRFRFNDGRHFAARDQQGNRYPYKWSKLNTGKGQSNRETLTFGLNEVVNYFLFNLVGVPAPRTHFYHFRVVDGAEEAPDAYGGDFWGLGWAQENYDVRFLDAHGLPKGNLYKLINSVRTGPEQLRYQAPHAVTDGSDMVHIEQDLTGYQSTEWLLANVNYPNWYRFHGIVEGIRHYDYWPDANKNAGWYFEPDYRPENNFFGRFWTLPWDTDSTWGPTWNGGQDVAYNGIFPSNYGGGDPGQNPELQIDYRNTVREIRDLVFQPDQIEPILRAFGAEIEAFVEADLARWTQAPVVTGNYRSLGSPGPALSGGVPAYIDDMLKFMFTGGDWPGGSVSSGGQVVRLDQVTSDAAIPQRPVVTYSGPVGYPVDALSFRSSTFADPQGPGTFAALQWRVAEVLPAGILVTNPADLILEWNAAWTSPEFATFQTEITVPPSVVQPGRTYRVRVRHQDASNRWSRWSAPLEFAPTAVDLISDLRNGLVFSEIMYNPPALPGIDSADLEFVEVLNRGNKTLDLSGLFFSEGIEFAFPLNTSLGAGERFLLARNPAALQQRYPGATVHGVYAGRLNDDGETLTLRHPHGGVVLSVSFNDRVPWPVAADGLGFSLVLTDPGANTYGASADLYGSPGTAGQATSTPPIVVSEVLTASTPPLVDAIELFNPTPQSVAIDGWWLTDDPAEPFKYRIPDGTQLAADDYWVVTEDAFGTANGLSTGFALSSLGDEIVLFATDDAGDLTGYTHGLAFGGAADGVSYGRWIISTGEEHPVPEAARTLGNPNVGPRTPQVVINEIYYTPAASGTPFIELRNVTWDPVTLADLGAPTNRWRVEGLGFEFPDNVILPPGGFALVVQTNPAVFRTQYSVADEVPVFETTGQLQTDGEWLRLLAPDTPTTNDIPYYPIDQVRYRPDSPWPSMPPEGGAALQRVDALGYGGEPTNWEAAAPTPGLPWTGSRPMLALSAQWDAEQARPQLLVFAEANRSFSVEFADDVRQPLWLKLRDLPIKATNRIEVLYDPAQSRSRFYRAVTPARP